MFKPEDILRIKRQLKSLNVNQAALEKAARSMMEVPELRKIFENQTLQKGLEGNIDKLYDEIQEIFNDHKEYPDGGEKETKSD